MAKIRQKGTRAELTVRRLATAIGLHYRLNSRRLPGSPDLSNASGRWAVFVMGCYWHGHRNCPRTKSGRTSRLPASHIEFWEPKFAANRRRDARKLHELRALGFRVLLVWECQLADPEKVRDRLSALNKWILTHEDAPPARRRGG